ncbi:M20/M25/M40 family metallo-hydrolase [Hugenholtzia roseola]|uniref:M20/M25/M40 family metallo-hydrolase n=1 Tax=Hugenholtzia roseola TaxID=1002 RepID=UPI000685438B|nr:M20/M25/M40 family metallo-hydrolase [Hugenholtzia roseola]
MSQVASNPSSYPDFTQADSDLLKTLCGVFAPAGNEGKLRDFMLAYIEANQSKWKVKPQVFSGSEFQDCIVMVFGTPRTAVFAHLDSIGFMVRYGNELIKVGSPRAKNGYQLVGKDSQGDILCQIVLEKSLKKSRKAKKKIAQNPHGQNRLYYKFEREIERGTELVFAQDYRETAEYVQSCYLDDRLGCWNVLKLAESLENGILVFSCYEEVKGGTVPFLIKWIYENYKISQALISDITWVTEGVKHGKGVAISMRDSTIPRRSFVEKIIKIAKETDIAFQLEVEESGGSDAKELQSSPYPIDWCFVGAPESGVHSPDEKVHKADIQAMLDLYRVLMDKL